MKKATPHEYKSGGVWTVFHASREFGRDRETIKRRLCALDIPDDGNGYTTKQICAAVFGDMAGEKLRLTREQADKLAHANEQARRVLINREEMLAVIERGLGAMMAAIQAWPTLTVEQKAKLIEHLRNTGAAAAAV